MSSLAARARHPGWWLAETTIARATLLVAVLTITVGLSIKAATHGLGSALPPFVMYWGPDISPLAPVSVAVLVAATVLAPELVSRARSPLVFAAGVFALALALGLALNLARAGLDGWTGVFTTGAHGSREAHNEYLPGLPALAHGISRYVRDFPGLLPRLPIHVQGNPPGPLVALHLLGIRTTGALTALVVGVGGLTAPLAYDLGRTLGHEEAGRMAGALTAFSPALLLFGVTSFDYAFAALGLASACLLVRRGWLARCGGCALAALGSFFSWLLLAIPVWAAITVLKRDGVRSAIVCAALSSGAVLVFNGTLALTLGYDPIAALRVLERMYSHGISTTRPYAYWVFGSPVAWGVMLGLPTAALAVRSLARGDAGALALFVLVLISAGLGFTKAESERIWLPFVPLACVAAGASLSTQRLPAVLRYLGIQAVLVELLFGTIW